MTTRQAELSGTKVRASRMAAATIVRASFSRTAAWLDRAMLGGATPRGYRREGYPEVELQQLISGRKDRFDLR